MRLVELVVGGVMLTGAIGTWWAIQPNKAEAKRQSESSATEATHEGSDRSSSYIGRFESGRAETAPSAPAARTDEPVDPVQAFARAGGSPAGMAQAFAARVTEVEGEKTAAEQKAIVAAKELEAVKEHAALPHAQFDVGPAEWKEMAKKGDVKFIAPCPTYTPSASQVAELGLSPEDVEATSKIFARERGEAEKVARGAAVPLLGDMANTAPLQQVILELFQHQRKTNADEAKEVMYAIGAIRAGTLKAPPSGVASNPLYQALFAMTGAAQSTEAQLTERLGPNVAKKVLYGQTGCSVAMDIGGPGPRT